MEALNQKERSFAEENHGLIYAFLNYYKLPEAEYYDICAIAYLHAVKDWHSKPELREKYRFSTIAFKKMSCAKINKYHADRIRDAYIAFSLNDLNTEGNEYMAQIPDPYDALREAQERQDIEGLLKDIMPALTGQQCRHLVKLAEGEKPREIMQELHISIAEFWKDRKAIKAAATTIIGQESGGGGIMEALDKVIKALSLDINKNKKKGINRMSKVKVLIEHEDGHKQELNGDTVICFTVSNADEFLNGKAQLIDARASFIGMEIPHVIYAETVGNLFASLIEKSSKSTARASFNLHMAAQILEAKSKEIKSGLTEQEKKGAFFQAMDELFKAIISKA